jgi:hypothetical protein
MKKSIVLFSIVLFCLSGIAKDLSASWVLTREGKMNCKKIFMGYNKARIVLENGQKKTIPVDLISSYTLNGKVFTRLPLYQVGKQTNKMVFMEMIKTQSDLSLYKYEYINYGRSAYDFSDLNAKHFSYFLYDDAKKLIMELDEKSLLNVCKLFGLHVRYE